MLAPQLRVVQLTHQGFSVVLAPQLRVFQLFHHVSVLFISNFKKLLLVRISEQSCPQKAGANFLKSFALSKRSKYIENAINLTKFSSYITTLSFCLTLGFLMYCSIVSYSMFCVNILVICSRDHEVKYIIPRNINNEFIFSLLKAIKRNLVSVLPVLQCP